MPSVRRPSFPRWIASLGVAAVVVALGACGGPPASTTGNDLSPDGKVGIVEHLGDTLPDGVMLTDETGREVELKSLLRGPAVLVPVYMRCPNVCNEVLKELGKTVDELERYKPGRDYDILTFSFDPRETPELAAANKAKLIGSIKTEVPEDGWRILTGKQEHITTLCEAIGFLYQRDGEDDFKHAGTVIFLTKEGRIVRYLGGVQMHRMQFELALNDARDDRARSFMEKIQRLCYRYDPEGKTYALQVNRIVLFVTLLGVLIFLIGVVLKRRKGTA